MAFGWIASTSAFGLIVRKAKMSFVVSPSRTFRTEVHCVHIPAKHASGRLSSKANHTGARPSIMPLSGSRKGVEWHQATVFDAKPAPPVWRVGISNIGDARITVPAFEGKGGRGHAPPRHRQLTALSSIPHDRRWIVWVDTGHWREVSSVVHHYVEQIADRLLVCGHGVEVAHNWLPCAALVRPTTVCHAGAWTQAPRLQPVTRPPAISIVAKSSERRRRCSGTATGLGSAPQSSGSNRPAPAP